MPSSAWPGDGDPTKCGYLTKTLHGWDLRSSRLSEPKDEVVLSAEAPGRNLRGELGGFQPWTNKVSILVSRLKIDHPFPACGLNPTISSIQIGRRPPSRLVRSRTTFCAQTSPASEEWLCSHVSLGLAVNLRTTGTFCLGFGSRSGNNQQPFFCLLIWHHRDLVLEQRSARVVTDQVLRLLLGLPAFTAFFLL